MQCLTIDHKHDHLVSFSLHRGVSSVLVVVLRVWIFIARFVRVKSPLLVELAPFCIHNSLSASVPILPWELLRVVSLGLPTSLLTLSVVSFRNCRLHSSSNAFVWARRILLILRTLSDGVSDLPSEE